MIRLHLFPQWIDYCTLPSIPHCHDDDQNKAKYRAIMNCHSVKNDAFVPRERLMKIISEIFIDRITFVVNFA